MDSGLSLGSFSAMSFPCGDGEVMMKKNTKDAEDGRDGFQTPSPSREEQKGSRLEDSSSALPKPNIGDEPKTFSTKKVRIIVFSEDIY